MLSRFDNVHGSDAYGNPVDELPEDVLDSIKRNGVSIQASLLMPSEARFQPLYMPGHLSIPRLPLLVSSLGLSSRSARP